MKKFIFAMLTAVAVAAAFAQVPQLLHVTGMHRAAPDKKTFHSQFSQNILTVTVGTRRYTLAQLESFGYYRFEVGMDYPITELTDKVVKVRVVDKKGRQTTERLTVVAVEEIPR